MIRHLLALFAHARAGHRIAWKRWLARHRLVEEFCHRCGRDVGLVWTAPDAMWRLVVGRESGILCIPCFDGLAAGWYGFVRWVPTLDDHPKSREPVVAPAPARGTDTGVPATGSQPTRRCAVCGRWDIGWNLSIHNPVETCESGCDASHHEPDWRDDPARPHALYVADPDEPPADFGQQVFIPGPGDELPQGPVGGYRESGRL